MPEPGPIPAPEGAFTGRTVRYRAFIARRKADFLEKGFAGRHFFPHKVHFLPKAGPDGLRMAHRMLGRAGVRPDQLWEIVLYALPPHSEEFPRDLFFDDDIVWHQQQLGRTGQVATANLVVDAEALYGSNYLSDLVQRISRNRAYKSRVENRFAGWPYMLINSMLNFALEQGLRTFYSATADFTLQHTDPHRSVQRPLFDRVYDRVIQQHFKGRKEGNWWKLDVAENRRHVVPAAREEEVLPGRKVICVCHDIERGLGHVGVDRSLANVANEHGPAYLRDMLAVERSLGIKASYNVVGTLLDEVRQPIEEDGHCLSFHSYDHTLGRLWTWLHRHPGVFNRIWPLAVRAGTPLAGDQLGRCRRVDYRLKGYRAPQSVLTGELSDANLCVHNFEWLGYYFPDADRPAPVLQNRIVKIPIQCDDYPMYARGIRYEDWEAKALQMIREHDFLVIGLHDCYGAYWLPHYERFLAKIRPLGELSTLNAVASEVFLAHGI